MDTFNFAIKACLGQINKEGHLQLVAYYLQKLTLAELNYNVYNKELLAIVVAFE